MIYALLDGDWLAYTAGFASQKTRFVAPSVVKGELDNITEVKAECKARGLVYEEQPVYSRTIVDPIDHVLHTVKHMLEAQLKKIYDKFGEEVKPVVLMDGDGNFRNRIATIKPYKGNRNVNSKPLMYNEIRGYLLDNWNATLIHDQETDDEMAIRQTNAKGKTIIVAVDKDMLQVPGWHLNPNKGFRKVSEVQGRTFLYRQCLTGDSVDNIGGCYKVGPKAAEKMITPDLHHIAMWEVVVWAYNTSVAQHGNHYNGLSGETAALENMRLVYLRRQPDEIWEAPK